MTFPPLIGPTAPERNPPIEPQNYQPSEFTITGISFGATTTVTTAESPYGVNNNYVIGQLVRFVIPPTYGADQLNQQTGYVIALPTTNQVTVNVNTTKVSPFNAAPAYGPTPPQLIPIGDVNSGQINSSGRINQTTYVPGSFINISPVLSG